MHTPSSSSLEEDYDLNSPIDPWNKEDHKGFKSYESGSTYNAILIPRDNSDSGTWMIMEVQLTPLPDEIIPLGTTVNIDEEECVEEKIKHDHSANYIKYSCGDN